MHISKILKSKKVRETHISCGFKALNFKSLKLYGFKVFSNFFNTLQS